MTTSKRFVDPTEKRRIGRFKITDDLILQDFHSLLPFMAKVVVVRCEHVFPHIFEYTAFSDLFEEVEVGAGVPLYEIEVSVHQKKNGDKSYSFKAVRSPRL